MEYQKPAIYLVGKALESIQSSLDKNMIPVDSETGTGLTGTAAYEADE